MDEQATPMSAGGQSAQPAPDPTGVSPEVAKFESWIAEDLLAGRMNQAQADQALKELHGETIEPQPPVDTGLLPPHEYQLSSEALNDPSFPAKDVQSYISMAGFEK